MTMWRAGLLLGLLGLGLFVGVMLTSEPPPADPEDASLEIADVASERLTPQGSVVGFAGPAQSHAWLGIPYAAAPVGDARWRAPRRAEPWTDTLDALAYASPCVQLASPMGGVATAALGTLVGSEDCLALNVWAPRFDAAEVPSGAERLPVMLWIHGGANTIGTADAFYEGALLAGRHELVVVTVNYRLGPLGWFAHPTVLGPSPQGVSPNLGTLDLIEALRWVRENIEFFGGDPNNVTVFGESAGGQNTISLIASPVAAGLFHRAIVQSGSLASVSLSEAVNYIDEDPPGDAYSAKELVLRLLMQDGTASDRETAKFFVEGLEASEIASYLRRQSPQELYAGYRLEGNAERIDPPRVIRDGVVLPETPAIDLFAEPGAYSDVPIILGSNRDEAKLFLFQNPEQVSRTLGLIRIKDETRYNLIARLHSDLWKARGVDEPARVLAETSSGGVYAYRFDWDEEPVRLGTDFGVLLGAAHGMEIPFVFGHFRFGDETMSAALFDEEGEPGRRSVSDAMMSYWAEFAYSGAPGRGRAGELPLWSAWSPAEAGFLIFDTLRDGGIRMSLEAVSGHGVLGRLMSEPGLSDAERCGLFKDLFGSDGEWNTETGGEFYAERYADLGCASGSASSNGTE
ncbi:MAG: carboxylesterase family protein [Myxococcota bacterium]|nr:carboxylesterase family protein [Myxococcota bacterium]